MTYRNYLAERFKLAWVDFKGVWTVHRFLLGSITVAPPFLSVLLWGGQVGWHDLVSRTLAAFVVGPLISFIVSLLRSPFLLAKAHDVEMSDLKGKLAAATGQLDPLEGERILAIKSAIREMTGSAKKVVLDLLIDGALSKRALRAKGHAEMSVEEALAKGSQFIYHKGSNADGIPEFVIRGEFIGALKTLRNEGAI